MTETIYLVHSGDKSSCMWKDWYRYWKRHYTCDYDTIFLSENATMDFPGVQFAHTGSVPWADGLISYLETCPAKYIIYTHEDYFLNEPTNKRLAGILIDLMKQHNIKLLKCCGHWAGCPEWNDKTDQFIETDIWFDDPPAKPCLWTYANKNSYLVSHQSSIWDRELLYTTLKPGEDPWGHELMGTSRLRARNIPVYAYRGKNPFESAETMVQGEIREGCEKYFESAEDK